VGLNPSRANAERPDPTLRKVIGFADRNGFDGFVMMNLYAARATFPADLPLVPSPKYHQQNLQAIRQLIAQQEKACFLACWGDNILIRPYLMAFLEDIYLLCQGQGEEWLQIGSPTRKGHPRHPALTAYALGFRPFDLSAYLQQHVVRPKS